MTDPTPHAPAHPRVHAHRPAQAHPLAQARPSAATARTPLRVVVADDNPVVRAGLTALLTGREDIDVVAQVADGGAAWKAVRDQRPDAVLLDVRMPGVDGMAALPRLVGTVPVLMLSYSRESGTVREALRLGAGGYLVHGEFSADQLVAALRDVVLGRPAFSPSAVRTLLDEVRRDTAAPAPALLPDGLGTARLAGASLPLSAAAGGTEGGCGADNGRNGSHGGAGSEMLPRGAEEFGLTHREVQIIELIMSGMTNRQIADACFISLKTVKNHINRIFTKLDCAERSEAISRWSEASGRGATGRG